MVALWRKWMRGCKFLVIRRDGTVPKWPYFVIGAADPAAPHALREYARQAMLCGMDADYCRSVNDLANEFEAWRTTANTGDPDAKPHRVDDERVVDAMVAAHGGNVRVNITWSYTK